MMFLIYVFAAIGFLCVLLSVVLLATSLYYVFVERVGNDDHAAYRGVAGQVMALLLIFICVLAMAVTVQSMIQLVTAK